MESCKGCKFYSSVTDSCDYSIITGQRRGCSPEACDKRITASRGFAYFANGLTEVACLAECDQAELEVEINRIIAQRVEDLDDD
jgi:hypothetical protein